MFDIVRIKMSVTKFSSAASLLSAILMLQMAIVIVSGTVLLGFFNFGQI